MSEEQPTASASEEPADALELPDFDVRSIKRSIRRALVRTAALTAVILLVVIAGYQSVSAAWGTRDADHLKTLVETTYRVAYPFYSIHFGELKGDLRFGASMRGRARYRTPDATNQSPTIISVRRDWRGRITHEPVYSYHSFGDFGHSPTSREHLDRLPVALLTNAVVEFRRPLSEEAFETFRLSHRLCGSTFQEDPFLTFDEASDSEIRFSCDGPAYVRSLFVSPKPGTPPLIEGNRVTWPSLKLRGFQRWAAQLRPSDERFLRALLLPRVSDIRRLAREGRIYGFLISQATPSLVRAFLADHSVETVSLTDATLDLQVRPDATG